MTHAPVIRRRDFILGGAKISLAFLASGPLASLFGQPATEKRPGSGLPHWINLATVPRLDDSLELLAAYLLQYQPPAGAFGPSGNWAATYDVIEWRGTTRVLGVAFSRGNRAAGRLNVTRRRNGNDLAYEVDQELIIAGFGSRLQSSMVCSAGPMPALKQWQTAYTKRPLAQLGTAMSLQEQGWCRDGSLEVSGPAGTRRIATARPVAPQWAVLDALRGANGEVIHPNVTEVEFDYFHDLTSFRPCQRLMPAGTLTITLGSLAYQLHGYLQIGLGTEPTHYWVDTQGRPLLTTAGLLASAMTALRPL